MREISTQIEIDAPASRIWAVLTDFPRYPEWNGFLLEAYGAVAPGSQIKFRFELPRGFRMWTRATVLEARPGAQLRWAGNFLFDWLFRAEHYFRIEALGAARARFAHGERFTGLLVPIAWLVLRHSGKPVYDDMNRALKQRAENGA